MLSPERRRKFGANSGGNQSGGGGPYSSPSSSSSDRNGGPVYHRGGGESYRPHNAYTSAHSGYSEPDHYGNGNPDYRKVELRRHPIAKQDRVRGSVDSLVGQVGFLQRIYIQKKNIYNLFGY